MLCWQSDLCSLLFSREKIRLSRYFMDNEGGLLVSWHLQYLHLFVLSYKSVIN